MPTGVGVPRLYRARLTPPGNATYHDTPICAHDATSVVDGCELVDDLESILGQGFDCENGSDAPLAACQGFKVAAHVRGKPDEKTPCANGCQDVTVDVTDPNNEILHLTLYDDVSCHKEPKDPNCPLTGRACYYRVLSATKG